MPWKVCQKISRFGVDFLNCSSRHSSIKLTHTAQVMWKSRSITNDDNTARRFSQEPNLAAILTGVNVELISRFNVIFRIILYGYKVNSNALQMYWVQRAEIYVALYPWFYMPSSMHKILIPIGMMSEEAQESKNKDPMKFRVEQTRKKFYKSHNGRCDAFTSLHFGSSYFLDLKTLFFNSRNQITVDNDVWTFTFRKKYTRRRCLFL